MSAERWEGLSGPYGCIVADPPWHYDNKVSIPGGNRADGPANVRPFDYSGMSLDEILSLPVADLAAPRCWLFLWTTNRYLPESFGVAAAWGFAYRQTLVWHKTGNPTPFGGTVAPNHAEYLIVAAKGKPAIGQRLPSSVVASPKLRQHSRKPPIFADLIESVAPGPYCELFARAPRLGWDHWGHGYEIGAA